MGQSIITAFENLAVGALPTRFMRWPMVGTIAACLANRTWVRVQRGGFETRLRPNLYTLLVAPTGSSKSLGIKFARDLLAETTGVGTKIHLYTGTSSAKGMLDQMIPTESSPNRDKLYLVQDELASDVGRPEMAEQYFKALTKMYYLEPYEETTRLNGYTNLSVNKYCEFGYCLNVMWATTPRWLCECMPATMADTGLLPRICTIIDMKWRWPEFDPPAPEGAAATRARIVKRLDELMELEGEFVRTPEAYEFLREWYYSRPEPTSNTQKAYFARERDWVEKLAMVVAAAEGEADEQRITVGHYESAIKLAIDASESPARFLKGGDFLDELRAKLRVSPNGANRSEVVRWAERRHRLARDVDNAIEHLIAAGQLRQEVIATKGRPKVRYFWDKGDEDE